MLHAFAMMVLSGGAVVVAGILLGYSADQISERTGLGEMWTGWLLLAAATSLPEFVTDVSAVRLHAANLAAGDLFGSSLTNMAILAVLVLVNSVPNASPITENAALTSTPDQDSSVLASAWLAILLTTLGVLFTVIHTNISIFLHFRPESLALLLIWIAGTRVLFSKKETRPSNEEAVGRVKGRNQTARPSHFVLTALVFAAGSGIIFLAAPTFANCARQFAANSGLGETFVGTWMLGFATALPEFVTSMTACRLGAFNLAVANLYGSCAFNMVVFFLMDLAAPRPIFSLLDPMLALSGVLALTLMLLGLLAVAYRRNHAFAPNLGGGALLACYAFAVLILYAFH